MKDKMRFFVVAFLLCIVTNSFSQNWTHFRGNKLDGIAGPGDYPVSWNDSVSVKWKVEIPGKGWSSPVVYGNRVWTTSATADGKEMFVLCNDLSTGKEIFNIPIFRPDTIYRIHAVNSYATPTSCIEEDYIYVHFGRYGTACLDTRSGEIVWKRSDLQCEHVQGPGSSLMLYGEKLIVHMEGTDTRYIYALDKNTGEIIWKAERPEEYYDKILEIGKKAYVTPVVVNVNGKDLLISNGSAVCVAYDLETGKEVWRIPMGEDSTISMPVVYDGIVYFYTSFVTTTDGDKYIELLAVNPDGTGDISDTNIIWRMKAPILQLLTPVVNNGLLFTVDTKSMLYCIDAKTGDVMWSEKLKGKYNASPVYAADRIYLFGTRGECLVYEASATKKKIAENKMPGEIWATPAFIDGFILLRTGKYLYRIEK